MANVKILTQNRTEYIGLGDSAYVLRLTHNANYSTICLVNNLGKFELARYYDSERAREIFKKLQQHIQYEDLGRAGNSFEFPEI